MIDNGATFVPLLLELSKEIAKGRIKSWLNSARRAQLRTNLAAATKKLQDSEVLREQAILATFKLGCNMKRAEGHICTRGSNCEAKRKLSEKENKVVVEFHMPDGTIQDQLNNPIIYWDLLEASINAARKNYLEGFQNGDQQRIAEHFGITDYEQSRILNQIIAKLGGHLDVIRDLVKNREKSIIGVVQEYLGYIDDAVNSLILTLKASPRVLKELVETADNWTRGQISRRTENV